MQGRPKMLPTYVRYLFLWLAGHRVLPRNISRVLRSQKLAFNALQMKGFQMMFAFGCFMTPGVLRATLTLFIYKRSLLSATGAKWPCYIKWRSNAMPLMCIMCVVAGVARIRCRNFTDKNKRATIHWMTVKRGSYSLIDMDMHCLPRRGSAYNTIS